MAAYFFRTPDGEVHTIGNRWSIFQAGFTPVRSYYNKSGDTLEYFIHPCGTILELICRRRHQSIKNFYNSKEEANNHFKRMNDGYKTFQDGKWVPERRKK